MSVLLAPALNVVPFANWERKWRVTYVDNEPPAVLTVHRVEGGTVCERAVDLKILISLWFVFFDSFQLTVWYISMPCLACKGAIFLT